MGIDGAVAALDASAAGLCLENLCSFRCAPALHLVASLTPNARPPESGSSTEVPNRSLNELHARQLRTCRDGSVLEPPARSDARLRPIPEPTSHRTLGQQSGEAARQFTRPALNRTHVQQQQACPTCGPRRQMRRRRFGLENLCAFRCAPALHITPGVAPNGRPMEGDSSAEVSTLSLNWPHI